MKGILEFNLPEEEYEFQIASKANNAHWALRSIDERLRTWLKHGHQFKDADDAVRGIRDELNKIMIDNNAYCDD